MVELLQWFLILLVVWFCYLYLTEPLFKEGEYVPFKLRIRKVFERVLSFGNKQGPPDP